MKSNKNKQGLDDLLNKNTRPKTMNERVDSTFSTPHAVILRKIREMQFNMLYYATLPWWALGFATATLNTIQNSPDFWISFPIFIVTTSVMVWAYMKARENNKKAILLTKQELNRLAQEESDKYWKHHDNN